MNAIYSVEQVNVPPELGTIMKQYTKAVLRDRPENVYKYSANFFAVLSGQTAPFDQDGQLTEEAAAGTPEHVTAVSPPSAPQYQPKFEEIDAEQGECAKDEIAGNDDAVERDVVESVFKKYEADAEGLIRISDLPELLADLREALDLSEEDLPPAEEIARLLPCEDEKVDLLELRQLLFEEGGE